MLTRLNRLLDHYRAPRVLGLDLLRIWASLTIVVFHGSNIQHRGVFLRHGGLAVDVFFVLSGWLLTRQALKMRARQAPLAFAISFWTRRWFRILPAYWFILIFVLAIGMVLPVGFGLTPQVLVKHLVFLQTVFQPNLYGVTWSLVAEEWFYLLLPFAIVAFGLMRRPAVTVACLVAILLVPAVGRAIELTTTNSSMLLQLPQVRFDGLVVGSALGALWSLQPRWRDVLNRGRLGLFIVGCSGFLMLYMFAPDGYLFWTVGLLAVCVMVGLMLPHLTTIRWPAAVPAVIPLLVTFLSDLTYPLYLFHPLGYKVVDLLGTHGRVTYFLIAFPLILVGAIAIHFLIERPFLALRKRLGASPDLTEPASRHSETGVARSRVATQHNPAETAA